jgi:Ca2+-binding RTX toxin-like protein
MTPNRSRHYRSIAVIAPAAALLVVGLAAPANALVTVSAYSVSSDAVGDSFSVSCVGGVLAATGTATTGDPCASMTQLSVDLGGGADTVNLSGVTAAVFPALISTYVSSSDSDADHVTGSAVDDNLNGDSEDTLSGGEGNDMISGANIATGGPGDDSFMGVSTFAGGGEGDDRFIQFTASAGIEGGPGVDSWEIDFDQATLGAGSGVDFAISASALTLDVRDDGSPAVTVPAANLEQLFLTLLRQGLQTYDGSTFPGTQHVRGMSGPDAMTGGPADDALYGGTSNDTVTGNAGADVLHGGDGDDTVNARDGAADRVDCGAGTDTVVADASDVVGNCESVQLPPVAPPVLTPPVAVVPVTGAISGPKAVTKPAKAKFTFSSTTAGATFQCKVDAKAWKTCASPYKVATKKLTPGKHKLFVRAVVGGATDATPSKKAFTVRRG